MKLDWIYKKRYPMKNYQVLNSHTWIKIKSFYNEQDYKCSNCGLVAWDSGYKEYFINIFDIKNSDILKLNCNELTIKNIL